MSDKPLNAIKIPLTKGKFALIDAEDYPIVSQWKWSFNDTYATRGIYLGKINGKRRSQTQTLHKQLMNTPKGFEIDHANGDQLDNRRKNLRVCTHKQNMANIGKRSDREYSSSYKGVTWSKVLGKWLVTASLNGKAKYIGTYNDQIKAANAYDQYAKRTYGEFAKLNF
jgi:hypothetical protein